MSVIDAYILEYLMHQFVMMILAVWFLKLETVVHTPVDPGALQRQPVADKIPICPIAAGSKLLNPMTTYV